MLRYKEGSTQVRHALKTLAGLITNNKSSVEWLLKYPTNLVDITDYFVVEKKIKNSVKNVFISFELPTKNSKYVNCQIGTGFKSTDLRLDLKQDRILAWPVDVNGIPYKSSVVTRFYWAPEVCPMFADWIKIHYAFHYGPGYFGIVTKLDATVAGKTYTSMAYFGELDKFSDCEGVPLSLEDNPDGNFGMCVSGDHVTHPTLFGTSSGNGVTDIVMLETLSGFPMQAHNIAFNTHDEFVDKSIEGPSAWTSKFHVSNIYVMHLNEGYRGTVRGAFALGLSGVIPFSDKYLNKGKPNQELYTVYKITSRYNIFSNSPNVLSGIALLKEGSTYVEEVTTPQTVFDDIYRNDFRLAGKVSVVGGSVYEGVVVRLQKDGKMFSATTNELGNYEIRGATGGVYSLAIYFENIKVLETAVEITEVLTVSDHVVNAVWVEIRPKENQILTGRTLKLEAFYMPSNVNISNLGVWSIDKYSIRNYSAYHQGGTVYNLTYANTATVSFSYASRSATAIIDVYDAGATNLLLPPVHVRGSVMNLSMWDYGLVDNDTVRIKLNGEIVVESLVAQDYRQSVSINNLALGVNEIIFEGLRSDEGDVSVAMEVTDASGNSIVNYANGTNRFEVRIPVTTVGPQTAPYPLIKWSVTRKE